MATWRDHPQWQRGYLWVHKPTVVFAAELHYTNTTTYGKNATNAHIWNYLFFQNVTTGSNDASEVLEGMTLLLGTTAGAYDLGRVRVKQVVNVNPPNAYGLKIWASNNIHDGEVFPASTAYITVLDQYLPWFKPPYYGVASGYVDGDLGPGGATHSQFPIANAGPGVVGESVTALTELDYSGGTAAASSEAGPLWAAGKAFDNSTGSYWKSDTSGGPWWLTYEFTGAVTVTEYSIYGRQSDLISPSAWTFEGWDGANYVTLDTQPNVAWTHGDGYEELSFPIATPGSYSKYRLSITADAGGYNQVLIRELNLKGMVTTPPTIAFSGADSYAAAYDAVLGAYGADITGEATNITATSEYDVYVVENAIDDDTGTSWRALDDKNERITITFGTARKVRKITITPVTTLTAPLHFVLIGGIGGAEVDLLEPTGLSSGWTAGVARTFYVDYDYPDGGFTQYKLWIVSINGGTRVAVAEFELFEEDRTTAYSWDVGDGTITTGTSASEDIEATFPAGFRYVHLTVTDSSTYTGIKHVPVVVVDEDYTDVVRAFEISDHTVTQAGQSMTFRVHEALDLDDYPPTTMVIYWEEENIGGTAGSLAAAGPTGREHVKFIGYLDVESTRLTAGEYDVEKGVDLQCVDIGGRLRQMPAFQVVAERATSVSYIYEMEHANIDRLIYLLVRWFSTAAEVADFYWSGTLDQWPFLIISAEAGNLYDSIDDRAQAIAHRFTCDKHGRLRVLPDPQLQATAKRTSTVIEDIDETDWSEINYTYRRGSRYHWQWSSAIQTYQHAGETLVAPLFVVGPGPVPGQGAASIEQGEQLVDSILDLTVREGHRYALRTQAHFGYFDVKLAHGADTGIDPARMVWVRMTISAATAAQRGYTFTDARFLPIEARIAYDHEAMTKTVTLTLEKEVIGQALSQYTPPE